MDKYKDFIKKHPYFLIINGVVLLLIVILTLFYAKKMPILNKSLAIIVIIIVLALFEFFIYSILMTIIELWRENPIIVIAGVIAFITIIAIMFLTNNTPEEITKNILVYLATIGSLLFVFVPQGLTNINEKYILKDIQRQPYDKEKLTKKNINISYVLLHFIGATITDVLITPIFNNRYVKSVKYPLYYDYFSPKNYILPIFSLVYLIILLFALASLISAFLEIYTILKYFYFYEKEFDKLNSKYKDWSQCQIHWVIENGLYNIFTDNNYEIQIISPETIFKESYALLNKKHIFRTKRYILKKCNGIIIHKI